jgi:hypothetical protein
MLLVLVTKCERRSHFDPRRLRPRMNGGGAQGLPRPAGRGGCE